MKRRLHFGRVALWILVLALSGLAPVRAQHEGHGAAPAAASGEASGVQAMAGP